MPAPACSYLRAGLFSGVPEYNFVMGVASGMPCDADLLALLPRYVAPGALWQTTLIGRAEVWPVHRKTTELGGMLRSGLEDTFYLPNGKRAASPAEARTLLGLRH